MKLTFLGGADEVGASGTLVEMGGKRILVDCGIRPSPKARWGLEGDQLPDLSLLDRGDGLDAILVTHAHTDHTGALELVTGRYPDIPVYATAPTITLTRVLHQDSRRIMQTRLEEEGELPLFDDVAVTRLMANFRPVAWRMPVSLGEDLQAIFFPAGHIAGASMIGLESSAERLLISGDLSISAQRTVDGARPPAFNPDALVIESTYGGRLHANRAVQERLLVKAVSEATEGGGKVLIPAFALGRAQELLLILGEFRRRGELPAAPVWADGMVRAICAAYAGFPDVLPLALQERGAQFFDEAIQPVASRAQRNSILWEPGPAVIVSSSGMLAGGPALEYARALASSPHNAILLTGYQDEESPGRRLQELAEKGRGTLRLGKNKVDVQCRLGTYSLSAHADEGQLLSLIETINPAEVLLVHGDQAARASLQSALKERRRRVHLPQAGQMLDFRYTRPGKALAGSLALGRVSDEDEQRRRQRRRVIAEYGNPVGQWLLLKAPGGQARPAQCLAVEDDHLLVQAQDEDGPEIAWPEAILTFIGDQPPSETLLSFTPASAGPPPKFMEPNQALAAANQAFPAAARLRKAGYRLAERVLTLTFDFPQAARQAYAAQIESLGRSTGWQVEVNPETNQNALNMLLRELLPASWQILKGPAVYREQRRVGVTIAHSRETEPARLAQLADQFRQTSGYELQIALAEPAYAPGLQTTAVAGKRLEINAAYAVIKQALAGSSLYRASLKGEEIVLSFISSQVGERYRGQIEELSGRTGWPISINPNPNQGAILADAQALIHEAGWVVIKGPSIFPERGEVSASLANAPSKHLLEELSEAFTAQTGYRLVIQVPGRAVEPPKVTSPQPAAVEIPIALIRLRPQQQALALNPERLNKAVERASNMGISPPVQVRRARDGYILIDGLYRLKAAQILGLERIPAEVQ
jgi:Cft2 family RNA processing exonuclease